MSETHLYSSAFVVESSDEDDEGIPGKFTLHGAGWGHGVGLCQIGAAMMAEKGFMYEDILSIIIRERQLRKILENRQNEPFKLTPL